MTWLLLLIAAVLVLRYIGLRVHAWILDGSDAWDPDADEPIAFTPTDRGWGFLDEEREVWTA